jgi:magnesium-transporting ATPase (P-type)
MIARAKLETQATRTAAASSIQGPDATWVEDGASSQIAMDFVYSAKLTSNPLLLTAVVVTIVLQLAVVSLPVFNTIFKSVPLRPEQLAVCIGCALLILAIVELEKWARRQRDRGVQGAQAW